jgi:uncharacterized membrane protein YccC
MPSSPLKNFARFLYSHYFVSALRLSTGVLLIFIIGSLFSNVQTASIAALGAAYVAFIDRPAPMWWRVKEMLGGALLGWLGVTLTGLALTHDLALLVVMVGLAFLFSMLVVYGPRGATIGLACMTLTIITMSASLEPGAVIHYSLISLVGALAYILYSMASGRLLQLREEQQCLSVALLSSAQYLRARAELYEPDVDIDQGYQRLITTQAQMIASYQGAQDAMLEHMSAQSVKHSPRRQMVWNISVDLAALVDLLISTYTDYTLLHKNLSKSKALAFMHDALTDMALSLEQVALAMTRSKQSDLPSTQRDSLEGLQLQLQTLRENGLALSEPETYAICMQIERRLNDMQQRIHRMLAQVQTPGDTVVLEPSLLEKSLGELMSSQSFSPSLLLTSLRFDNAAFRYALRVSLAVSIAMVAGILIPDTAAHGYWIVLTVIVIMKPAFSMTKKRNSDRLVGTLTGCAIVFALLHLTTNPYVLLPIFSLSLALCFVFFVTTKYLVYSMFISISVLLMLHWLMPHTINLPTERAIDTVIGSLIALACSFVLPWWEAKSLPKLALNTIQANANLLRATSKIIQEPQNDLLNWRTARHQTQMAFSAMAQGLDRMMAEPPAQRQHVAHYNNLVISLHALAAEVIKTLHQAKHATQSSAHVAPELEQLAIALQTMDFEPVRQSQAATDDSADLKRMRQATEQVIDAGLTIGLTAWDASLRHSIQSN